MGYVTMPEQVEDVCFLYSIERSRNVIFYNKEIGVMRLPRELAEKKSELFKQLKAQDADPSVATEYDAIQGPGAKLNVLTYGQEEVGDLIEIEEVLDISNAVDMGAPEFLAEFVSDIPEYGKPYIYFEHWDNDCTLKPRDYFILDIPNVLTPGRSQALCEGLSNLVEVVKALHEDRGYDEFVCQITKPSRPGYYKGEIKSADLSEKEKNTLRQETGLVFV
jgi:hypothetical protein